MLVLSRKEGESIVIGDDVVITVQRVDYDRGQVKLGIKAPDTVRVDRMELRVRKLASEREGSKILDTGEGS